MHRPPAITVQLSDKVAIGGGAPVLVQSMTDTLTSDPQATAQQVMELADAGAEAVRVTVDTPEAAKAVPEIRKILDEEGYEDIPLIGDFHYNGHMLLRNNPDCGRALAKFRINPGNVGSGFEVICRIASDLGKAIRIGVNSGSVPHSRVERLARTRPFSEALGSVMVDVALESVDRAIALGLDENRIVLSAKVTDPNLLIRVYRRLAAKTRQPLHLGLTEAGMGIRGIVWSVVPMALLLAEGIGDTIRVSLTPEPGGSRAAEVVVAWELLQALGLRRLYPSVIACPGCGRTSSDGFRRLASMVEAYVRRRWREWKRSNPKAAEMSVAVMGCIVNGPGESKHADIGISLPGKGEEPKCPVYVGGKMVAKLEGSVEELFRDFIPLLEETMVRRGGGR